MALHVASQLGAVPLSSVCHDEVTGRVRGRGFCPLFAKAVVRAVERQNPYVVPNSVGLIRYFYVPVVVVCLRAFFSVGALSHILGAGRRSLC